MSNTFRLVKYSARVDRGPEKLFSCDRFSEFNFRANETSYGKSFFALRPTEARCDIYLISMINELEISAELFVLNLLRGGR